MPLERLLSKEYAATLRRQIAPKKATPASAMPSIIEGSETTLVENGQFVDRELRRLGIRTADLDAALRRSGDDRVSEVQEADLYPSGALVVDLDPGARGASREDVQRLERKLDLLAASVERLAQAGS